MKKQGNKEKKKSAIDKLWCYMVSVKAKDNYYWISWHLSAKSKKEAKEKAKIEYLNRNDSKEIETIEVKKTLSSWDSFLSEGEKYGWN